MKTLIFLLTFTLGYLALEVLWNSGWSVVAQDTIREFETGQSGTGTIIGWELTEARIPACTSKVEQDSFTVDQNGIKWWYDKEDGGWYLAQDWDAWLPDTLKVEWLGLIVFYAEEKDPRFQRYWDLSLHTKDSTQLGLREDGILVWRKRATSP